MAAKTGFPVGYEDFAMIRKEGLYYVDKTGFIKTLLENPGKVKLFTRPRRFGKTLNMSMLKYFFSVDCDRTLFDGLMIAKEKELCGKYMGKFPVVSLSLKAVEGGDFEEAKGMLRRMVGSEMWQCNSSSLPKAVGWQKRNRSNTLHWLPWIKQGNMPCRMVS